MSIKNNLWTRFLWLICFLLLSNIVAIYAQEVSSKNSTQCLNHPAMIDVKSTIGQIINELDSVKSEIKRNPKVVYRIINQLLVPKADFKVMSQLVLTRNWRNLSDKQQAAFIKEFERLIVRTYGIAFETYDGETVEYLCPVRKLPGSMNRVEISTTIHSVSRPDSIVKFRILERNQVCNSCTDKFDACKKVGDACKNLQKKSSKADVANLAQCKADYDACRQDVTECKTTCEQCQKCTGSECNKCKSEWLVYDLIIDNISIIDSYRQIFTDKFRKQQDANVIIAEMHDKNCKDKEFCS